MLGTKEAVFRFGDVEVREREFRLIKAGEVIPVEPKAFRVLLFLLHNPQKLITKEELLNAVWGETAVSENSLTRTIALLRRLLGEDTHEPKFIETVATVGYRFLCSVVSQEFSSDSDKASPKVVEAVPILGAGANETSVPAPLSKETDGSLFRPRWPWVLAAGLVAATGIALVWMARFSAPPTLVVTSIEAITHDGLTKIDLKNDGSRVYFTEVVHQRYLLSQVSAGGGEISRIASPLANTRVQDVAPDGSKLLVSEAANLGTPQAFWILPLPSGTPRRLGALEGHTATWSRDGKRLVFARSSELWTAESDGTNPKKLTATSGVHWGLQFSPDGERIRYMLVSRNTGELWESATDGSAAHALLPGWHAAQNHSGGVWSPDGRYYAFAEWTGNIASVWVLPETRTLWSHRNAVPAQLTHGPLSFYALDFSPSNRTLFAAGTMQRGELVRYDPGTRQVSPYLSGISAGDLAFSRDGRWIAYVTYPDETLWRCRIDGSDRQQLTTTGSAVLPQWSPDGRSVAYVKNELGKPSKITIIPMNGGNAEEADQGERNEIDANWSPDGTKMIFGAYDVYAGDTGSWEIRERDLRTHKVTPIPGSKGLFSPRWSPDGRHLAALSVDAQRLMLFDFKKQIWTTWITAQDANTRNLAYPVWSRDGSVLYFGTLISPGVGDVYEWRTRPGQRVAEKILDLQDEPRYLGRWDDWSTVGPDGAVYFTRDRSSTEIYALHLSEK